MNILDILKNNNLMFQQCLYRSKYKSTVLSYLVLFLNEFSVEYYHSSFSPLPMIEPTKYIGRCLTSS